MRNRIFLPKLVAVISLTAIAVAGIGSLGNGQENGVGSSIAEDTSAPPALPSAGQTTQEGIDVLTSGPVHEAFASPTTLDPEPGLAVPKAPPQAIEEVPPDEQPEGNNVIWIPGYYAWDDEREDFIWISGLWRNAPPGQRWVPGYWTESSEGFRWTPGFWTSAQQDEIEYLEEAPPESIETGPSSPAPSDDHFWIPGSWVYRETRYVWRPGYWYAAQPNWIWTPARYVWCPSGYVYVNGYWDYVVARRGCLFAPVYFSPVVYARPAYVYTPSVVINIGHFTTHLFARPAYCHYYFGDFYAARHSNWGIRPWFAYGSRARRGYDHLFTYYRWHNSRRDRHWATNVRRAYERRHHNALERPPRTLAEQQKRLDNPQFAKRSDFKLASHLREVSRDRAGGDLKWRKIDAAERIRSTDRAKEFRQVVSARAGFEKDQRIATATRNVQPNEGSAASRGRSDQRRPDIARNAKKRSLKLPEIAKNDRANVSAGPRQLERGKDVARSDAALRNNNPPPNRDPRVESAIRSRDQSLENRLGAARNENRSNAGKADSNRAAANREPDRNERPRIRSPFTDDGAEKRADELAERARERARETNSRQENARNAIREQPRGPNAEPQMLRNRSAAQGRSVTRPNITPPPERTRRLKPATEPNTRNLTRPGESVSPTPAPRTQEGRTISDGRQRTMTNDAMRRVVPRGNSGIRSSSETRRMLAPTRDRGGSGRSIRSFSPQRREGGGQRGREGSGPSRGGRFGRGSADAQLPPSGLSRFDIPSLADQGDAASENPSLGAALLQPRALGTERNVASPKKEDPTKVAESQSQIDRLLGIESGESKAQPSFNILRPTEQDPATLDAGKPSHLAGGGDSRSASESPIGARTGMSGMPDYSRKLSAAPEIPSNDYFAARQNDGAGRLDRATVMSRTDPDGPVRRRTAPTYDYHSLSHRGRSLSRPAPGTYARVMETEPSIAGEGLGLDDRQLPSSYAATPGRELSPTTPLSREGAGSLSAATPAAPTGAGSIRSTDTLPRLQQPPRSSAASSVTVRRGYSYDPTRSRGTGSYDPTRSTGSGSYNPTRGRTAPRSYYQTR